MVPEFYMRTLKVKKVEDNCKHLLSKIHVRLSEICLRNLLSAVQQLHFIEKVNKINKWFLQKLSEFGYKTLLHSLYSQDLLPTGSGRSQ